MSRRTPLRLKLLLLAGIPVMGALILAVHGSRTADEQTASARALGSIEDLATLSQHMNLLLHELSLERSLAARHHGPPLRPSPALESQHSKTDDAIARLDAFLGQRQVDKLPARLAQELLAGRERLRTLRDFRSRSAEINLLDLSRYYDETAAHLIGATAALGQLSDDGEMLRSITALVTLLEAKERLSRQQAVLSNALEQREFPPGSYRSLVTLVTEEQDYVGMLQLNAPDELMALYLEATRGPEVARANEMRQQALDTTEEELSLDAGLWFDTQALRIERLRELEVLLNRRIGQAAADKVTAAKTAVRLYYGLAGSILVVSVLFTGWVGRGISRSVGDLTRTAIRVREDKDFSVRATKSSNDELGTLTDSFNEMLGDLQVRDVELARHRQHLEVLVEERTLELERRNRAMRLVLNHVDQGLTVIGPDGAPSTERSRAFDLLVGATNEQTFWAPLTANDPRTSGRFSAAWEQFQERVLPAELALAQLPTRITLGERSLALAYKPIDDGAAGVLLIVSDVTQQELSQKQEAEQRELVNVVGRMVKDRAGFMEFLTEADELVQKVMSRRLPREELRRVLHTLKGNCGLFEVRTVEAVAHALEDVIAEGGRDLDAAEYRRLLLVWQQFSSRARPLLGEFDGSTIELSRTEFEELARALDEGRPHEELGRMLERLACEPVEVRLHRLAEQIQALAQRMGKAPVRVEIDAHGARVPRAAWADFWGAFSHVVRNAVDHGLETSTERRARGKPSVPTIRLTSSERDGQVVIELSDDGQGIDWKEVQRAATRAGLPHATPADLEAALFADGVTTRGHVTEISGRGLGLSVAKRAALSMGGTVRIQSERGKGTSVRFEIPEALARQSGIRVAS